MLHSTFKNLPSGSHADKNFILRLINPSSMGIGLISVWRKPKTTYLCRKQFFSRGGGEYRKEKLVLVSPRIMKQINKIAAALSTRSSEVCSSVTVPQKAISPGQAQQTLIKSEAERETAGHLYCYILEHLCVCLQGEKQSAALLSWIYNNCYWHDRRRGTRQVSSSESLWTACHFTTVGFRHV